MRHARFGAILLLAVQGALWTATETQAQEPPPSPPEPTTSPSPGQSPSPAPSPSVAPVAPPGSRLPVLLAPVPVERPSPPYPPDGNDTRAEVDLLLRIGADGHVVEATIVHVEPHDAAASFGVTALEVARAMSFHPATRDGTPIPSRIHYLLVFEPPAVHHVDPAPADDAHAATTADAHAASSPPPPRRETETSDGASASSDAPASFGATARASAPPPRSASDFHQEIGALADVPVSSASGRLRLAPGILLTNEGGEGHAERVYLRGFDAHEGQDLEFLVDGLPFNEVGNPHGEGYADTHFIVPELIESVRVLEGPFDPRQGNYAVAGTAEYHLGLPTRGLQLRGSLGSYGTQRLLALWGPRGEPSGTFAGADLERSNGFGTNRAFEQGRAMAQAELALSRKLTLRVLGFTHAIRFGSAGVVREDDYRRGTIGFFGSYDPTQGGDTTRHGTTLTLEHRAPHRVLRQQLFASLRTFHVRANFTGFVQDPIAAWRTGTAQRGDAVDQTYQALTLGGRGSMRLATTWGGLQQALEVGYFARIDALDSAQRRLRFGTTTPYRIDFDRGMTVANVGIYLDGELRPFSFLAVRGGVRGDSFQYQVDDRCALHETTLGGGRTTPLDTLCYDRDRIGPRDPTERFSASGSTLSPRASATVGPFHGVSFAAAVGRGSRAADPAYLAEGTRAPFVSITGTEAGVLFNGELSGFTLDARALYYYTHTGQDLIFNEQEGRNALAPGTDRMGTIVAARLTGPWLDVAASATYAHARYASRDTADGTVFVSDLGTRVLYVPDWVVRMDAAVHGTLPFVPAIAGEKLRGRAGLGVTYVSPRALAFGEESDSQFVVDASAAVRWSHYELGVSAQNLLDTRYRLAEFNYVSDFVPNNPTPNMVAARHFTAGAPLTVLATFAVYLDDEAQDDGPRASEPAQGAMEHDVSDAAEHADRHRDEPSPAAAREDAAQEVSP